VRDARFPERWLNDRRVLRLSDAAFRLFVISLAWSVANKTDGYLPDEDLALIPGVNLEAAAALYDAELWWSHMHGAQITEFEETQTTSGDLQALANARRRQRDKMRRRRSAAAAVPGDVPGDVPGHSSGHSTRTGQARPGAKSEDRAPLGFQPNSASLRLMLRSNFRPPEATVTPLLRRNRYAITTARTPWYLTINRSLIEVHPGPSLQTVTRARRAPSAA
jgi:hypothetical protein